MKKESSWLWVIALAFLVGVLYGNTMVTEGVIHLIKGGLFTLIFVLVVLRLRERRRLRQARKEERWNNRALWLTKVLVRVVEYLTPKMVDLVYGPPRLVKPSSPGTGMATTCAAVAAATGTPASVPETPETSASSAEFGPKLCADRFCLTCYPDPAA